MAYLNDDAMRLTMTFGDKVLRNITLAGKPILFNNKNMPFQPCDALFILKFKREFFINI